MNRLLGEIGILHIFLFSWNSVRNYEQIGRGDRYTTHVFIFLEFCLKFRPKCLIFRTKCEQCAYVDIYLLVILLLIFLLRSNPIEKRRVSHYLLRDVHIHMTNGQPYKNV